MNHALVDYFNWLRNKDGSLLYAYALKLLQSNVKNGTQNTYNFVMSFDGYEKKTCILKNLLENKINYFLSTDSVNSNRYKSSNPYLVSGTFVESIHSTSIHWRIRDTDVFLYILYL